MKGLVNVFLVFVLSFGHTVNCMNNEDLYSGNPGSSNVKTFLYLCKREVSKGLGAMCVKTNSCCGNEVQNDKGRFIGVITVDFGESSNDEDFALCQKILWNLVASKKDNSQRVSNYPKIIWSGSVIFLKGEDLGGWSNKSVVKFYPAYNGRTYVEANTNTEEGSIGYSVSYKSNGVRDEFVRKGRHWLLKDKTNDYFHSSDGDSMIQPGSFDEWGGIETILKRALEFWVLDNPLSMGEFLTKIGQSQGHRGIFRNRGMLFAPNCYIFLEEDGKDFCNLILKEFKLKRKEQR